MGSKEGINYTSEYSEIKKKTGKIHGEKHPSSVGMQNFCSDLRISSTVHIFTNFLHI